MKTAPKLLYAGAALIVLLTVAAYLPALRGGFVWDDILITGNPMIRAGNGLHRFWFTTEAMDYWPLTSTIWWLEWRLWGNHAAGYHVVNVLLHAVNAILAWMILRRLKIPGAWLACLVFSVHPVNVATAAWVSEQKNTLSMLLYSAAALLYLRFDENGRWPWYGFSLAAFLLALLSKAAVVMLPVVLLGCVWWRRGQIRWQDAARSIPFFILSLVLGLTTIWFQHHRAMEGYPGRTDCFLARLASAGWVPWFYLYKDLWPCNLCAIYPKWNVDPRLWVSYLPGMVLVGCFALFWWKRGTWGRPLLFALGYFVLTLFPVLGFIDQSFYPCSLVADQWQYCSIIGVIVLTEAAGVVICHRLGERCRRVGLLAGAAVLVVLGTATWRRSCVYADNQTFWRDTLARNPNAWLAHNNLGYLLAAEGDLAEANWHYREALRLNPCCAPAHNNLGYLLAGEGDLAGANWHYREALRLNPGCAPAHNNLGNVLLEAGKTEEAIEHYEQALRIVPSYAEAHNNLGVALRQAGRLREAVEHYEQSLRIKPDYAEAHYNLGVALEQAGQARQAVRHWEQALRIKPDYAEAHYSLAWLLAMLTPTDGGDPVRAVSLAQRACKLTGDHEATYLDALAVAYAAAGRFDDAIDTGQRAIELARSARQPELVREIEARLELYRSGRPYRQSVEAVNP